LVNERPFQFEWDEAKADANVRKHGVTFELASTIFFDPNLLTVADVEHSEAQERWFPSGSPATVRCCRGLPLVRYRSRRNQGPADISTQSDAG
jgi:uncharacterized DUF497 family protein